MATSLIINSQDSDGKNYQQSLSFVNSAMSSAALKELATMITSISTNQYVDAYVVDKNSVDEERTIAPATKQIARIGVLNIDPVPGIGTAFRFTYNGDGTVLCGSEVTLDTPFCTVPAGKTSYLYALETDNFTSCAIELVADEFE